MRWLGDAAIPAAPSAVTAVATARSVTSTAGAGSGSGHVGGALRQRSALAWRLAGGDLRWTRDHDRWLGRSDGRRFAPDVFGRGPALPFLWLRLLLSRWRRRRWRRRLRLLDIEH